MNRADIIRQYLTNNARVSKRGLAQILVKNHPDLFKDVENARMAVRHVTGAMGEKARSEKSKNAPFYGAGFQKWAGANLRTEEQPWDNPYDIPNSIKTLNVIADLHSINLCPATMEKFMKRTTDKTAVLVNGDLLDSESLSRHMKLHNLIDYEKEIEICHEILKGLKAEFDHVYFKAGNHDFWLERYLLNNAREIFRLRGLEVQELLQCAGLGVHFIHNLRYIKYGDLDIIHGHEFNTFGSGKFPSVGYVDKWQTFRGKYDIKLLASHSHRQDHSMSRRSKDGKYGEGWVTPAMCRKSAQYSPYAGWDNGWAVLTNNEGKVSVELVVV